jgi:hypothetical protein
MRASAAVITKTEQQSAMKQLQEFLSQRRLSAKAVEDLAEFERQLHKMVAAVECEAIGEELKKFDLNVPEIEINGYSYKQVLRSGENYLCVGGEVRVERSLYRAESDERAISAMELQAGIVEGLWTPLAAEIGAWTVAHLTPREGEELFQRIGGMQPSRSSLDRLLRGVGQHWEADRKKLELAVGKNEEVPPEAVSCGVSLDGVMVPLKDGQRNEKRDAAKAEGKRRRGPAGYGEAGCGTVSFYDRDGELITTVRMARMPESKKATLKEMITREVQAVQKQRPDLKFAGIADGAKDNWKYLDKLLPDAEKVLDFYHSAEHLQTALNAAYGEGSAKSAAQFEKLRHILRHEENGVASVIRSLIHLRDSFPRRRAIARELAYFRKNRKRMRYAQMAEAGLPIGSGIVEAACKTLVAQRLKQSGMRWREEGGQAVLTLRSLIQSDRFDRGWKLLLNSYKAVVALPNKVLSISISLRRRQSI